ncbi:tetraspanin-33 [Aplysia californica]|uniref:Tetraspanin n=1 Tax=Aplysia californica TaxID=6500 RepID=A0ABM0K0R4_APLCA|nr:tetraspanin-33 [Aplysia californica]
MDDEDTVPTISGNLIMAYGETPKSYVRHRGDSHVCTCLFWSRYTLFVINFLIVAAGATLIGLGAWALVNSSSLELFQSLLKEPSWMLVTTGMVMVVLGVCGCAGALRLNVFYLRLFMVLVVVVFILQLTLGAIVFFLMEDIEARMLGVMRSVVVNYVQDSGQSDDLALDYLQREFQCCAGSSYSDWEANPHFNCSHLALATCGVPSSCCRGSTDMHCGYGVREGTVEYAAMFSYTKGCIVSLMDIFKENVLAIAAIAFSVSFLQMCSLILANIVVRKIVYHRKLIP